MRLAALLLLPLAGCTTLADLTALGAGAGAGSVTGNPAIGYAVGVGAQAGLLELSNYVSRRRHGGEQDAIAAAAGDAPVGATVPWQIRHTVPVGNARGELAVAREFRTPLATCREVVFTVAGDDARQIFTTSLCRWGDGRGDGWKWAVAEPSTERWGSLQ